MLSIRPNYSRFYISKENQSIIAGLYIIIDKLLFLWYFIFIAKSGRGTIHHEVTTVTNDMDDVKRLVAQMRPRYPEMENPEPPHFMCGALLPEIRECDVPDHSSGHGNPSPLAESAGFYNGI